MNQLSLGILRHDHGIRGYSELLRFWRALLHPYARQIKEARRALPLGAVENLDQGQEPESTGGHAGFGRDVLKGNHLGMRPKL